MCGSCGKPLPAANVLVRTSFDCPTYHNLGCTQGMGQCALGAHLLSWLCGWALCPRQGRGHLSYPDGCVFIMPSRPALSSEFPFTCDELLGDQVCILGIILFFFF